MYHAEGQAILAYVAQVVTIITPDQGTSSWFRKYSRDIMV